MKDTQKNIRRVFWLYFILFLALQVYLAKFILVDSKNIITLPQNKRLNMMNTEIKRGSIFSSDGEILAESNLKQDVYERNYFMPKEFVHVIGNVVQQISGVEAKYNYKLQTLEFNTLQRLKNITFGNELKGNSLVLTIDSNLQKFAYNKLGEKKGAIVVMEPSTGKILAMVSYPNYDPNKIEENWETLRNDETNAPLLNRASKGLYPPGSVFKIITAIDVMRSDFDFENYYHECLGEITMGDVKIRCFNNNAHGKVNLEKAIAVSCNTYFAKITNELDNNELNKIAEDLYFNREYKYPLEYSKSSFVLNNDSSISQSMQTSIGQGKTLVTPLHLAMITSAFANGGIMMEPYILDYIMTSGNRKIEKYVPKVLGQPLSSLEATTLTEMMKKVITEGTAKDSNIKGIEVAGKTGTAQNSTDKDHGLFVAFAPAQKPEIVVVVVLESIGGSDKAIPIGRDIIKYYLKDN